MRLPPLIGTLLVVLSGCGFGTGPLLTPSAPPIATPGTAAPTATTAPNPSASTDPGPVAVDVIAPRDSRPEGPGLTGIDWSGATAGDGYGSVVAAGPAGWLYLASHDGKIPVMPRLRLSSDLRSWADVTPTVPRISCGDGGSLAGSESAYVLSCGGVWRSDDGRTWTAASAPQSTSAGLHVDAVASDGRSFVGWDRSTTVSGLWYSSDGRTWTVTGLPGDRGVVDAVAGRPTGGYVVAGRVGQPAADLDPPDGAGPAHTSLRGTQAFWASDDGRAWSAPVMPPGFEDARANALAADGPGGGVVAVGLMGQIDEERNVEPVPTVWRSVDLVRWERLIGPAVGLLEPNYGDTRVVATTQRWLLLGSRLRADAASLWDLTAIGTAAGSEDGRAWWGGAPIPLSDEPYTIADVAVRDGRIVVLGNDSTGDGGAHVWVSPPVADQ